MVSGGPGHDNQSTGSRRQISPDETDATCLLAGQHRPESYGWARRRPAPQSAMVHGCGLHRGQTTNHHHPAPSQPPCHILLVDLFSGACLCRRHDLSYSPCWFVVSQGARPTTIDAQRVSGGGRIPGAARAAQLDDLPHQAAAIEFSSSFCAVEKRLGAASEATGMSGLGQVGGPSLPPMCPSGGVIAGDGQTACCCCAAVATPTHRCSSQQGRSG
jgi:hypothetical protein